MLNGKFSIKYLLVILILINIILVLTLLTYYYGNSDSESSDGTFPILNVEHTNSKDFNRQKKDNEIAIFFNILDIYRIDISCDYITNDLGQKIPKKYRNLQRKCAFASLYLNINEKIRQSTQNENQSYIPIYEPGNFDPFKKYLQKDINIQSKINYIKIFESLKPGGYWEPKISIGNFRSCKINDLEFIVFIIPISSDRLENLKVFLLNIHLYLQTLEYKFKYQIVIAEQTGHGLFNKGRLFNKAFEFVSKNKDMNNVDCVIIHDVDLIPTLDSIILGDKGDYRCRQMPWHMSNEVFLMANSKARVYNRFLTGGILSLRPKHFIDSNGFSNNFFGWGAEDDDFTLRMFNHKLCIQRSNSHRNFNQAPFTMFKHKAARANGKRFKILINSFKNGPNDGLSNINELTHVVKVEYFQTFTYLLINVNSNN